MEKINVLIIGNGHYATGITSLEGKTVTDKDFGILLPSVLELRRQGFVNNIFIAARDSSKFPRLREKITLMEKRFGWKGKIKLFPRPGVKNDMAFVEALQLLPRPGAVLISTPDFWHKQMIIETLKKGLHFMVVKPAVVRLADLEEIMSLQQEKKVLGFVDYHKVYDEANLILKEDYQKGKYGDILHILTKMTQRRDMIKIFKNWIGQHGHNVNHYLGSHYIHLVGFITGATPLHVRATAQYGIAKKEFGIQTPDLIETQITWSAKNGTRFVSYHIAGWADPSDTPSMTYQEVHIIATKGHIDSDQRYRGFETVLSGEGHRIINPYFFHLNKNIDGLVDIESKYGFKSVKSFIQAVMAVENGRKITEFEQKFPTVKESLHVTAILEATDLSLANDSLTINLNFVPNKKN